MFGVIAYLLHIRIVRISLHRSCKLSLSETGPCLGGGCIIGRRVYRTRFQCCALQIVVFPDTTGSPEFNEV